MIKTFKWFFYFCAGCAVVGSLVGLAIGIRHGNVGLILAFVILPFLVVPFIWLTRTLDEMNWEAGETPYRFQPIGKKLTYFDRCPGCGLLLSWNMRIRMRSWKELFSPTQARCRKCGLIFDYDSSHLNKWVALMGIPFVIGLLLEIFVMVRFDLSPFYHVFLFMILAGYLGFVNGRIRCFSVSGMQEKREFPLLGKADSE